MMNAQYEDADKLYEELYGIETNSVDDDKKRDTQQKRW